jgi:hypothetical protein
MHFLSAASAHELAASKTWDFSDGVRCLDIVLQLAWEGWHPRLHVGLVGCCMDNAMQAA